MMGEYFEYQSPELKTESYLWEVIKYTGFCSLIAGIISIILIFTGFVKILALLSLPFLIIYFLIILGIYLGLPFYGKDEMISTIALFGYAILEGLFITPIIWYYLNKFGGEIIWLALFGTGIIFFLMYYIGRSNLINFKGLWLVIFIGSIALFLLSLVNIVLSFFMHIPFLSLIITIGYVIIITLFLGFFVQSIDEYMMEGYTPQAIAIYLFGSLVSLFIDLLRLLSYFSEEE
jgi:FtsH-binding integral membrane protein